MGSTCLYIAYCPDWGDNRAVDLLQQRGWTVHVCCPARGDPVPQDPGSHDGVMIGGGLDDVVESSRPPYVDRLIELARTCVQRQLPFTGFCFGAQILAAASGGRVLVSEDGRGEFGFRPVRPTGEEGNMALRGLDHAYHLHYHGFEAPPDAVLLARGSRFPDSAFRIGRHAWGFQFHPEIRADQVASVTAAIGVRSIERRGGDPIDDQHRSAVRHEPSIHAWLDGFIDRWVRSPRTAA